MKTKELSTPTRAGALPSDLEIIPAATIRARIPETSLWRLERSGELPALRIGRRRFYRLSDWQAFLNRAAKAPPVAVPWAQKKAE
jgi:DNA-binding transcriptional regulator PaaX